MVGLERANVSYTPAQVGLGSVGGNAEGSLAKVGKFFIKVLDKAAGVLANIPNFSLITINVGTKPLQERQATQVDGNVWSAHNGNSQR